VFGVDFSMGTLRQGQVNIARDGISNIRLARCRAEELPFEATVFDAALVCGALHLFPDTLATLREVARTMKPGAPLVVTTFVAGDAPLTGLVRRRRNMHVFEVPVLQGMLEQAGFTGFESELDGTFLTFRVRKAA
jgi:ubiquinone/menaquinone biosynthesis C-methylase UbiE